MTFRALIAVAATATLAVASLVPQDSAAQILTTQKDVEAELRGIAFPNCSLGTRRIAVRRKPPLHHLSSNELYFLALPNNRRTLIQPLDSYHWTVSRN